MTGVATGSARGRARRLIVDASVAIEWLVEEESSEAALALRDDDLAAPSLLRIEVANVLRTLAARGQVSEAEARELPALFQSAPMTIVEPNDALECAALDLALRLGHPIYDCLYLALAVRMGRTLVTADARFLRSLAGTGLETQASALGKVADG